MCELCKRIPCLTSCPNFIPPRASHYCSICGEGIYDGEKYIENDFKEYIHEDCIEKHITDFKMAGYIVKIMENI